MTITIFSRKALLVFVVLIAAGLISYGILRVGSASFLDAFVTTIISSSITAVALTFIAAYSQLRGIRLALALSTIFSGIQVANGAEAILFLHMSFWAIIMPIAIGIIIIPFWTLVFPYVNGNTRAGKSSIDISLSGWIWRLLVCDVVYLLIYLIAGYIVYPFVREFYSRRDPPILASIATLQLTFRGPLFAALCALLARILDMSPWLKILTVGSVFSLLSGVVPLIVTNPYFPDAIRWVHFCEVTSSNFAFGVFVTWIVSSKQARLK